MSDPIQLLLGENEVPVKRWLNPNADLSEGMLRPFMVESDLRPYLEHNKDAKFVYKRGDEVWIMQILTLESKGSAAVWVTGKLMRPLPQVSEIAPPSKAHDVDYRGTLLGAPVHGQGLNEPTGDMSWTPTEDERDD